MYPRVLQQSLIIYLLGIREFCCKVCNYRGVTQSDLNRHMKSQIHMLKSRNECSYCGEGFVTAKNLEKHLDGNCIIKVQQEKGEYLFWFRESLSWYIISDRGRVSSDRGRARSDWWEVIGRSFVVIVFVQGIENFSIYVFWSLFKWVNITYYIVYIKILNWKETVL